MARLPDIVTPEQFLRGGLSLELVGDIRDASLSLGEAAARLEVIARKRSLGSVGLALLAFRDVDRTDTWALPPDGLIYPMLPSHAPGWVWEELRDGLTCLRVPGELHAYDMGRAVVAVY